MTDHRFYRFTLGHLIVLTMVIGSFLSGRQTMHARLKRLEDRAYVAERNHEQARESLQRERDNLEESNQLARQARQRIVDILATSPTSEVIEVIDGCTIHVARGTVKLKGVDRPFGDKATNQTSSYCGRPVWIIQQEPDGAAIVVSKWGDVINDELVRFGLARAGDENRVLESIAQKMKRGMWSE